MVVLHALLMAAVRRFDLPHSTQPVGLPVGQHISLKAVNDDGVEIMKPYTPVSDLDVRGYVEFVIKVGSQSTCRFSRIDRFMRDSNTRPYICDHMVISICY